MKTAPHRGLSHISSFTHHHPNAKVTLRPQKQKPAIYQFWLKIIKGNHKKPEA
jgi:hypothetical protein